MHVPQYEGLGVEQMIIFSKNYPQVAKYLPIEKEIWKLPRQYLINIIFTVLGAPFSNWVRVAVTERHLKLQEEKNMMVEVDADIA